MFLDFPYFCLFDRFGACLDIFVLGGSTVVAAWVNMNAALLILVREFIKIIVTVVLRLDDQHGRWEQQTNMIPDDPR